MNLVKDHVTVEAELASAHRHEKELRLALSLTCELHGCGSESCTAAQYHEDAQVMIRRVETAEAERDALQAKLDESEKNATKYLRYHDQAIAVVRDLRAKLDALAREDASQR
jgi:hypothetical protein